MLPPELRHQQQQQQGIAQGIDPSKIQLPCAHCKSLLNVPHGLDRFMCPQCKVELAVDLTKLHNYLTTLSNGGFTATAYVSGQVEEVNEVS